jgi:hypothetical protein
VQFFLFLNNTLGGGQYVMGYGCPGFWHYYNENIKKIFLTWDGNGKKLNIKFGLSHTHILH